VSAAEHIQPDETDRFLAALPLEKYANTRERRESLFMLKCLRLATDLETFEALRRGEKVPRSRLDPEWAKAYGY
jgi:hypothetical protein